MRQAGGKARMLAVATAAALATAGVSLAQDDDDGADAALCGSTFAQSGAATSVAYVGGQLGACDALLLDAHSASELTAAGERIIAAHSQAMERWGVVAQDLVAAAGAPAPRPAPAPAGGQAAAAPAADPWSVKLAERHAVETGMDGLRILLRLSYQLAETYAAPASLAAGLEGDAAARVNDVLATRRVCASKGVPARGNSAATAPSWYVFADIYTEPDAEPINYEREVRDEMAGLAEDFVTTELATARSLGVTSLDSFESKIDCPRREFPSQNPPS